MPSCWFVITELPLPSEPGRRDGENAGHGKRRGYRLLIHIFILPDVAVIQSADGDAFGAVYHAAAADGQDEVHVFFARQFHAFQRQGVARVGVYAAKLDKRNGRLLQRSAHTAQQAGFFCALPAVMQQYFFSAARGQKLADVGFFAFAEYELSRRIKIKIQHKISFQKSNGPKRSIAFCLCYLASS